MLTFNSDGSILVGFSYTTILKEESNMDELRNIIETELEKEGFQNYEKVTKRTKDAISKLSRSKASKLRTELIDLGIRRIIGDLTKSHFDRLRKQAITNFANGGPQVDEEVEIPNARKSRRTKQASARIAIRRYESLKIGRGDNRKSVLDGNYTEIEWEETNADKKSAGWGNRGAFFGGLKDRLNENGSNIIRKVWSDDDIDGILAETGAEFTDL